MDVFSPVYASLTTVYFLHEMETCFRLILLNPIFRN